jgi:integrase
MAKRHALHQLTAKQVRSLPLGWTCDGGGLYAFIAAPGSGSWVFRYGGKNMGLGPMAVVSLADARERARECRELRARGLDPKAERAAGHAAAKVAAARAITFDQCAAAYIESHAPGWRNPKSRVQWTSTLASYASPVFGALPVDAIDTGMVMRALQPLWPTKNETASRLRGRIESVLSWAKVHGYRDGANPAQWRGHLDVLLPARGKVRKVEHYAALPYAELPAFLRDLRGRSGVTAPALEFTILCATRTSETLNATWSEFDLHNAVWTIPAERMKMDKEHRVPLCDRAAAIVADMQAAKCSDFVFPGARRGKPLSDMALLTLLRRMGRGDLTTHGFRSSFRDWISECTSFSGELAEAALAHAVGNRVEAAYRRGDLFEKRRRLMQAWGDYASGARASGEVVELRGGMA